MSYYNHRNYQLAVADRQRAMAAQQQAQNIRNQANARANRMSQEWQGSHGDPRATVGHMNNMLSRENSGHYAEMANRQLDSQQAYANALNNEITQMQDRMADMSENVISSKNRSDEMSYNLQMTEAQNNMRARMAENNARIQMNSKTNDSLSKSMDGFNETLAGGKPDMPSVELYDNDGEYIGGSQYAGKNLFDKTGIKKSLMS